MKACGTRRADLIEPKEAPKAGAAGGAPMIPSIPGLGGIPLPGGIKPMAAAKENDAPADSKPGRRETKKRPEDAGKGKPSRRREARRTSPAGEATRTRGDKPAADAEKPATEASRAESRRETGRSGEMSRSRSNSFQKQARPRINPQPALFLSRIVRGSGRATSSRSSSRRRSRTRGRHPLGELLERHVVPDLEQEVARLAVPEGAASRCNASRSGTRRPPARGSGRAWGP